ncbi:DinB family protein [Terrabacter aeriphilus]|uniref:DinB family protein n=1 Tax=Terrabacter aeriphilus TaxID=515662 RepID=UPI003CD06158
MRAGGDRAVHRDGPGVAGRAGPRGSGPRPVGRPGLAEVVAVRERQAAEVAAWLADVAPEQLARPAPVPDDDRWPPYATGRSVQQCLVTVLNEEREHHGFCVRDLDALSRTADR